MAGRPDGPEKPLQHAENLEEVVPRGRSAAIRRVTASRGLSHAVFRMAPEDQPGNGHPVPPLDAADSLMEMPEPQVADLLKLVTAKRASAIVNELENDEKADLLGRLRDERTTAVLEAMQPESAREAEELLAFPRDETGRLMITKQLVSRDDATVADVLSDLRERSEQYADFDIQHAYVVDSHKRSVGVLRLRDLLLGGSGRPVRELMIEKPTTVLGDAGSPNRAISSVGMRFLGRL